jgi:hypothetical protein
VPPKRHAYSPFLVAFVGFKRIVCFQPTACGEIQYDNGEDEMPPWAIERVVPRELETCRSNLRQMPAAGLAECVLTD